MQFAFGKKMIDAVSRMVQQYIIITRIIFVFSKLSRRTMRTVLAGQRWWPIHKYVLGQALNSNTDLMFVLIKIRGIHQFSGVFNHRNTISSINSVSWWMCFECRLFLIGFNCRWWSRESVAEVALGRWFLVIKCKLIKFCVPLETTGKGSSWIGRSFMRVLRSVVNIFQLKDTRTISLPLTVQQTRNEWHMLVEWI